MQPVVTRLHNAPASDISPFTEHVILGPQTSRLYVCREQYLLVHFHQGDVEVLFRRLEVGVNDHFDNVHVESCDAVFVLKNEIDKLNLS